ncbi:MAG: gas vesicle protein [Planctomycetota bacterium]
MEPQADVAEYEDCTVLELVDRLLNQGVVLSGDLAISVADIELIYARLQLSLSSVETARQAGWYTRMRTPSGAQPVRQHG